MVKILTSTSAIFTANPIIVVQSVFLKKSKQLFYKKAGVVSRLISLGSYLIKLVNCFRESREQISPFFHFMFTIGGRALS